MRKKRATPPALLDYYERMKGADNPMRRPEVLAKRTGKNHPFYGRTHTPEARAAISAKLKGRDNMPPEVRKQAAVKTSATMKGRKWGHVMRARIMAAKYPPALCPHGVNIGKRSCGRCRELTI